MNRRMKKFKLLNLVMIILIVCLLYMELNGNEIKEEDRKHFFVQKIEDTAGVFFFPGKDFKKEETLQRKSEKWIVEKAIQTLPFSKVYVQDKDREGTDEGTWSLLKNRSGGKKTQENGPDHIDIKAVSGKFKEQYAGFAKEKFSDFDSVIGRYYTVDSVTYVRPEDMDPQSMLGKDLTIDTNGKEPKILIFHTHSQEDFVDSVQGDPSTTIVGMGGYLTELLNTKYHIPTMHHEGVYDLINGRLDRSEAYQMAKPAIRKLVKEHPSIEVVIDLHRDGVSESTRLVTEVNGKPTAKIMFFNGMCRTRTNGNLQGISNPYLKENLSFSMQMKMAAEMIYPGFTRKNYLKGYKYNMDFVPRMLLIEAGAQNNTIEEMKNAMEPLAHLLYLVLTQHP